jgi:hypothetical protein
MWKKFGNVPNNYSLLNRKRTSWTAQAPNFTSNPIRRKLPRLNAPLEHNIQLLICPSLHLRNSEPAPHQTRHTQPAKEEAQFAPQVRLVRVDEIRDGDSHDDADGSLNRGGYGDGLGAHASSAHLAEDSISYWSDTGDDVKNAGTEFQYMDNTGKLLTSNQT